MPDGPADDGATRLVLDAHAHCTPAGTVWRAGASGGTSVDRLEKAHRSIPPSVTDTELLAAMDGAGVDGVLIVTPSVMRYDNAYSVASAARHPARMRVVAHVDATAADPDAALREAAALPYVVGVRVMLLGDDAPRVLGDSAAPLWAAASTMGVPVAVFAPGRAGVLGTVARAYPDLTLVVDHAGADIVPGGEAHDPFGDWDDVLALAAFPRVVLKVSGLPEADPEGPPFATAQRRVRELLGSFGAERLMWGSNYTPVLRVCSYTESLTWLLDGCEFLDDADRRFMLGGTATRVYGAPWAPPVGDAL